MGLQLALRSYWKCGVVLLALLCEESLGQATSRGLASTEGDWESWQEKSYKATALIVRDGVTIVDREVIVGTASLAVLPAVQAEVLRQGGCVIGAIPRLGALRVVLPEGDTLDCGRERMSTIAGVRYVEFNSVGEPAALDFQQPNDPLFAMQWHLENQGQTGGKLGADIRALDAWEIQPGVESVVVAVLDSGIDLNHPELEGRLVPGWDILHDDNDPSSGIDAHGLRVTGVLAARADNGIQVAGVDRRCSVMPIKFVNNSAWLTSIAAFNMAAGIDYAVSHGASVISISYVGFTPQVVLDDAMLAASASDVLVVVAGGNTAGNVADSYYPAASPLAVTIGWTNHNDTRAVNASTGTAIDFVAPGRNIPTLAQSYGVRDVVIISGSSLATPLVAGVASLLLAENPYLSAQELYEYIRLGADDEVGKSDEDSAGWDPFHGHGRVNAFRSLLALRALSSDNILAASPPTLSLTKGGTWVVRIEAGTKYAGHSYVLLGSWSGTDGVHVVGVDWPLTLDRYFWHGLTKPNTEPLLGNVGVLDADGKGMATLTVPPDQPAWMGGATLHHAVAIFDGSLPHPLAMPPLLVSEPVALRFDLPSSDVFEEDFEQGAAGWIFDNGGLGHWHVAPEGECGARTTMAAYTPGPESCTIPAGLPTGGVLRSPSFAMTGKWPFSVSATMRRASTASDALKTEVRVVDETGVATVLPQVWANKLVAEGANGTLQRLEWEIPNSSKLMERVVHLEFIATGDGSTPSPGWLVDDVSVTNAGEYPPDQ